MEPLCFINGATVPLKDAKIGVLDLGVLRSFGVYDGLTAFSGEPFRFDDHWERFSAALGTLGLTIPHTKEEVRAAMRAIIAHNAPGSRANLRMVLTGGAAEKGIGHIPGRETLFITAEASTPLPAALYERGGRLIRHEHQRFMPEIKTTNYLTAVMLQKKRIEAEAVEILYTSRDRVLECATSNVFIVKDGTVITPDADILKGVTRKVVLELALGTYPVEERAVSIDELLDADEVFITGSFKDIMPIVSVDGNTIGAGVPGPITHDLMKRFAEYTKAV
ncbi:MAG: aminotransferase class IV [Parcubacteria group bacterium Gr01-1014_49]|nr:MAG: aminotransferase class IV [Parcubacteria group bacterium Gr01-1014_49]